MIAYHNDNRVPRTYAVLDVETLFLREAYEQYAKIDPRAAEIRWPFKSVCAAALLMFEVDAEGIYEFGGMHAWAGDDEAKIVDALFDRLRMNPDATTVTWGGLNLDLPVLRMAAMRNHLRLPPQLIHNARRHRERCHLDLAAELRAGGQSYVHLSEVATVLRLPTKFGDRASSVPALLREGKLRRLQEVALVDVIATSLLLQSHLEVHGELVSARAAQIQTLRHVVDRRPEARFADYLRRVEQRLAREVIVEAQTFVASVA